MRRTKTPIKLRHFLICTANIGFYAWAGIRAFVFVCVICVITWVFCNVCFRETLINSSLAYHQDLQVYYSYDIHWNQLGSYIGVKKVLDL